MSREYDSEIRHQIALNAINRRHGNDEAADAARQRIRVVLAQRSVAALATSLSDAERIEFLSILSGGSDAA